MYKRFSKVLAAFLIAGLIMPMQTMLVSAESSTSAAQAAEQTADHTADQAEAAASAQDKSITAVNEGSVQEQTADLQTAAPDNLADQADLMEQYFMTVAGSEIAPENITFKAPKLARTPGKAKLSERELLAYNYVKAEVEKIARGERADTIINVPATAFLDKTYFTYEELGIKGYDGGGLTNDEKQLLKDAIGVSAVDLVDALLVDAPYEMYWYDKTEGFSYRDVSGNYYLTDTQVILENSVMTIALTVSADYSAGELLGSYTADTAKTSATTAAAENAAAVVNAAASANLSDYDKLRYYSDQICDLVEYNEEAAYYSGMPYGDPWQLIYVFDGDDSTNVVCEGYAKAFKHLCDLSEFDSNIVEAYIVYGYMGTLGHMWNLVRMNDDKMYHVDITNCDDYGIGYPDLLFLRGRASGDAASYIVSITRQNGTNSSIQYTYDSDSLKMYSDKERTVSQTDYVVGTADNKEAEAAEEQKAAEEQAAEEQHQTAAAANSVVMEIKDISSWIDKMTYDDADAIQFIKDTRADYEALSPEAKALVPASVLRELEYAENRVEQLRAEKSEADDLAKTAPGTKATVKGNTYQVLTNVSGSTAGTVAFTKAKNKKSVTVPDTVTINNKKFKVTQINAKAFKNKKIRNVTIGKNVKTIKKNAFKSSKATKLIIKTKKLKKSTVKGSFKSSKIKTIQVKLGSKKTNKKYIKNYKKIFTKNNAGKKVTVK